MATHLALRNNFYYYKRNPGVMPFFKLVGIRQYTILL